MKDKLDAVDYKILGLMSDQAQIPFTEVAKMLMISPGTVHSRIKKMKNLGAIKGAKLSLDYSKMGWKMTVFLGLTLKETMLYKEVISNLRNIPEVVEIHHTTGKYDLWVKIHAKDGVHYRTIYQESILTISGIKEIETIMSVEESMRRHLQLEA